MKKTNKIIEFSKRYTTDPNSPCTFRNIPKDWSAGGNSTDNPYFHWDNLLTSDECDYIRELAKEYSITKATIEEDDGPVVSEEVRPNVNVRWLPYEKDTAWLYELIWHEVSKHQVNGWNFDIRGIFEQIQFTSYDATKGESYYNYHKDTGANNNHRKISLTVQLTDPSEYEGGTFHLENQYTIPELKEKGSAVMFPSFVRHHVAPVIKGKREVLVIWISGPKLR